jgi:hypothetical protein
MEPGFHVVINASHNRKSGSLCAHRFVKRLWRDHRVVLWRRFAPGAILSGLEDRNRRLRQKRTSAKAKG